MYVQGGQQQQRQGGAPGSVADEFSQLPPHARIETAAHMSKDIKCWTILHIIIVAISFVTSNFAYMYLFMLPGPICGFFGCKQLKPNLINIYMCFLILNVLINLVQFFFAFNIIAMIISGITVFIYMYVFKKTQMTQTILSLLTDDERLQVIDLMSPGSNRQGAAV